MNSHLILFFSYFHIFFFKYANLYDVIEKLCVEELNILGVIIIIF